MKRIDYNNGDIVGPYNVVFIKEIDPYISPKGQRVRKGQFLCSICNERTFEATISRVRTGQVYRCACCSGRFRDLTGQTFGYLTALEPTEKRWNTSIIWRCKCICGNEKEVASSNLINGNVKSCGCIHRQKQDLIGKRFGKLVVLKFDHSDGKRNFWLCQCDCGKQIIVSTDCLKGKAVQSCGCKRTESIRKIFGKDITGQRFGKLIALEPVKEVIKKNNGTYWKCQCDCGNIIYVPTHWLISKNTQSCGCLSSRGEAKIKKILNDNDINYKCQKTFDNCRNPRTNAFLKFDFYLPNHNCCIEYDGEQHFKSIDFFGGEERYKEQLKLDDIKNKYCKDNNIKLIRIPYTDYDKLNLKYLLEKVENIC